MALIHVHPNRVAMTLRCCVVAFAAIAWSGVAAALRGAEPCWEPLPLPAARKVGTLSCSSTSCHGNADELEPGESIAGHEHTLWVEFDPHAKAAATLGTARYRAVLDAYHGGLPAGTSRHMAADRCAVCHDPQGLAHDRQLSRSSAASRTTRKPDATSGDSSSASDNASSELETTNLALSMAATRPQGIGCEDCHGPGEKWLANHYERTATRESLRADGYLDLKQLVTRGRVCAGCHVGDADHDLTHDMYAAGHPPLRFDLSTYHDLVAVKHWPERERLELPAFKLRLWASGQAAMADAILGRLEARAANAAGPALRDARGQAPATEDTRAAPLEDYNVARSLEDAAWPEFAEYDCFACHQRLRSVAADLPGPGTAVPGAAGPGADPAVLLDAGLRAVAARPGARDRLVLTAAGGVAPGAPSTAAITAARGIPAWQPWNQGLAGLYAPEVLAPARTLMEARFAPDPAAVRTAAQAGRRALRESATGPLGWRWSEFAAPAGYSSRNMRMARRAQTSAAAPAADERDDSAAAAADRLLTLLEASPATPVDWSDASQRWLAVNALVRTLGDERRRLSLASDSLPDLERTALSLRFGSTDFDWPRYDWVGLPGAPSAGRSQTRPAPAGGRPVSGPPVSPSDQPGPALDRSLEPLPDLAAIGLQFRGIVGQLRAEWPRRPGGQR